MCCPALQAQQTIVTGGLQVKDSLSLKGQWINTIRDNPASPAGNDRTVSTAAVVKQYIDQHSTIPPVTTSSRMDSVLTLDANTRQPILVPVAQGGAANTRTPFLQIAFRSFYGITQSTEDSIRMEITSSDSIRTIFYFTPTENDMDFAFGKPPFTAYITWVNKDPDKICLLKAQPYWKNGCSTGFLFDKNANYNDTIILRMNNLAGMLNLSATVNSQVNNPGKKVNVTVRNLTSENLVTIRVIGAKTQLEEVYHGPDAQFLAFVPSGTSGSVTVSLSYPISTLNGEYLKSARRKKIKCTFFRNGVAEPVKLFEPGMQLPSIPISEQDTNILLLLEDI
ncbi:hypothetical protein DF182_20345 [Chitinophaga flava]|uniref:Uncharacterized protein n=1 Tax=Chitinophaga flava TaxID=2259036 RepID=A0A365XRD9_9BACT|nr:hypothetical protein DF182_20345 [Chitinophaga flava]